MTGRLLERENVKKISKTNFLFSGFSLLTTFGVN